jgi:hypothetical protein
MSETMKDAIAIVGSVALCLGLIFGFFAVVGAQEDEPLFNCYVSGNMNPGPECPWHGFVNLGASESPTRPMYKHLTTNHTFELRGPVVGKADRVWLYPTGADHLIEVDLIDLEYNFEKRY